MIITDKQYKQYNQDRNQEFFKVEDVSSNLGTLINIHVQHEKEWPRREKIYAFVP